MKRFYAIYGGVLLAGLACFHFFGWGLTSGTEVKGIPKTVRENPGVYRTHYIGGK